MYIYKDEMFCEVEKDEMCAFPKNPQLAHAYVPYQHAKCIYSPCKGLCEGCMFPDLIEPYNGFEPTHCKKEICEYQEPMRENCNCRRNYPANNCCSTKRNCNCECECAYEGCNCKQKGRCGYPIKEDCL